MFHALLVETPEHLSAPPSTTMASYIKIRIQTNMTVLKDIYSHEREKLHIYIYIYIYIYTHTHTLGKV